MTDLDRMLERLGACTGAREWAKNYATLDEAWEACEEPWWMMWLLFAVAKSPAARAALRRIDNERASAWASDVFDGRYSYGTMKVRGCDLIRAAVWREAARARKERRK